MNLTEDELVTLGIFCEALLQHEHWQRLVSVFEHQQFASFMGTDAKSVKEREHIYAQFSGVQAFLGTLADLVKLKAQIEQRNAPSSEDDDVLTQEIDN
jgi:hypothetical protein